jgi:mRNA interferase HigB
VRVLGRDKIARFCKRHALARKPLSYWLLVAEEATWRAPKDIKTRFSDASFLANDRVIFNIKGNSFRLVVDAFYANGMLIVEWVGTHAEYDRRKF